jgi:hypothetical protein
VIDDLTAAQERFLAHFNGVKRVGDRWMARCPGHEDHHESLSIKFEGNKILVHDFGGCGVEYLLGRTGLKMSDLFLDGSKDSNDSNGIPVNTNGNNGRLPTARPRIVATYSYVDEIGALLFEVQRFEPKGFRQRKPEPGGAWSWRLNGARRVLYNLPQVLEASDVVITEGEKDADNATKLGFVATCNPGGAGKWRDEYSECLRGKSVTIIADADAPGRKHAQQVAVSLHLKAASVKTLELPGMKDLSEWVEHGGTRGALVELIQNVPEWVEDAEAKTGFVLTPLADLLARPNIPVEYVVENLLVAGTVACVVAKPKVGKSTFARNLCFAVSRGSPFLGLKTKQGECIYLALEEREEDLKNDFQAMGANGSEPIYTHAASAPAEGIDAACDLVRQRRPTVIVIDPLFRLARIRDEKAYAETYAALGPLIDVAREVGTLVVLVHHAGKSTKVDAIDSPLGSTAIGGAVSTVVLLKKQTDSCMRTIQTVPRIGQELSETILRFDPMSRSLFLGTPKDEADVQAVGEEILGYLKGAGDPKTEPEIDETVEGQTKLKRKALRFLVGQHKVAREGSGKRGDPYKYAFLFSCSKDIAGTKEQENVPQAEALRNQYNSEKKACSRNPESTFLVPGKKQESEEQPSVAVSDGQTGGRERIADSDCTTVEPENSEPPNVAVTCLHCDGTMECACITCAPSGWPVRPGPCRWCMGRAQRAAAAAALTGHEENQ